MSIYRDKTRGCYVFEFSRRVNGERVRNRKSLPKTWSRAQAESYDRTETAKLYAVIHRIGPEPDIESAVAAYLDGRLPELKASREIARELALILPFYQGRPLSALPDVCKAIVIKGKGDAAGNGKLAPATIKKRIRYLTSACRWAWKNAQMGEHDPAERVTVPVVKNERHVYIGRAEMLTICKACPERRVRAAIRIAFYTGMRLGEVCRAQLKGNDLVLPDTKNGERRIVPVHPRIATAVKVPLYSASYTSQKYRLARDKAGMQHVHFHDLRHSAASEMINNKVDLYTVGAVLGHKSAQSTQRYAHLATDALRAAVLQIGKKVA